MNDRFKVIVVFSSIRKIERIIDFSDYEANKSIFNTNGGQSPLDEAMTKVFPNGLNISIGESVDAYNDDGTKKKNSELFELGLLELKEDEMFDGEEIREKTEIEKFRENPTDEKIIDTDDTSSGAPAGVAGNEYVRDTSVCCKQKSMLEKYNDNIITKDEYNEYQKEQRASKYQYTTDPMYQSLSVRKLREDISNDDYALEVEKIENMIWHLPAVSVEIKAEFSYME